MDSFDNGVGDNLIFHSLNVKKMIYIDDFLFLLGSDLKNTENEILIQTKGIEIKNTFKVNHDKTEVLKKCQIKSEKWILTYGYDDSNDDVM